MGYDVYITRKADWADTDGPTISRTEWMSHVGDDPELISKPEVIVKNEQGDAFNIRDETLAVWSKDRTDEFTKTSALLWLSGGNVVAKNPDRDLLTKMGTIARALNAQVQGEDGVPFGGDGLPRSMRGRRGWWRFWSR
ncbi:MAG: hypothetical protein OXQ92_14110 [Boseongicola sp.]|nr:hypothetical protein [Boseongicola sp.]MDD9978900.1 hypothetical protein [Boseongicola sp.]